MSILGDTYMENEENHHHCSDCGDLISATESLCGNCGVKHTSKKIKNGKLTLVVTALIAFFVAMITPDIYTMSFFMGANKGWLIVLGVSVISAVVIIAVAKPKTILKHLR